MAFKVLLLVAISIALVQADNDCNCEKNLEGETNELWKFLTKLSEDYKNPDDTELSSVYPGVLSPLLECNCLEKNRRKRKVFPDTEEDISEEKLMVANRAVRFGDRNCPRGFVRIGVMCLDEAILY